MVSLIRVDSWSEEELQAIAIEELKVLGRTEEKSIIERITKESKGKVV